MSPEPPAEQKCNGCLKIKPIVEFVKSSKRKNGYRKTCKECRNKYQNDFHRQNPHLKSDRRITKYGITVEEFNRLDEEQGHKCKICRCPPEKHHRSKLITPPRLHIDHDHLTGKVRGLVCSKCNFLIGYVESYESELVNGIIKYLEDSNAEGRNENCETNLGEIERKIS